VQFGGISNQHAIHLATLNNAKILGLKKETGSIEAGKSADFMVVDGNPLKNLAVLAKPVMVCARGNLIEKPKIKKVRGVD
jgi:imidazolonepropionase-like amidohydrolase